MKYFFMSDTHGVHPKNVMLALSDKGFKNENKSHKVVVAGDITDGLGCDGQLIDYFMQLEKQGQLIAVKGNHDKWTYEGRNRIRHMLNDNQAKWLKKLPYQLENEHFLLAHGMWLKPEWVRESGYLSSWGSPCLIGRPQHDWWQWTQVEYREFYDKFKHIDEYEQALNKPLYIGHFWPSIVDGYLGEKEEWNDLALKIKTDDQGLITYGKINWVDGDILHSTTNEVKIKVVEY